MKLDDLAYQVVVDGMFLAESAQKAVCCEPGFYLLKVRQSLWENFRLSVEQFKAEADGRINDIHHGVIVHATRQDQFADDEGPGAAAGSFEAPQAG